MCMNVATQSQTGGKRSSAVLLVYTQPIPGDMVGHTEVLTEGYPSPEKALERIQQIPSYCWGSVESLSGEVLEEFGRSEF